MYLLHIIYGGTNIKFWFTCSKIDAQFIDIEVVMNINKNSLCDENFNFIISVGFSCRQVVSKLVTKLSANTWPRIWVMQ